MALTLEERELKISQAYKVDALKRICNLKIEVIYQGPERNFFQETRRRLSFKEDFPEEHAKMEAWRKFYQVRYKEIKWWILNEATFEQLQNVDFSRDKYWTGATWKPHGSTINFDSSHVPAETPPEVPDLPS